MKQIITYVIAITLTTTLLAAEPTTRELAATYMLNQYEECARLKPYPSKVKYAASPADLAKVARRIITAAIKDTSTAEEPQWAKDAAEFKRLSDELAGLIKSLNSASATDKFKIYPLIQRNRTAFVNLGL